MECSRQHTRHPRVSTRQITMPANPLIPTKKQPTNQTSNRLTNYSNVRPNKSSSQLTNAMTNQTIRQLSHLLTNELHLCQASAIFCSSLIFLIFFPHKLGCFLPAVTTTLQAGSRPSCQRQARRQPPRRRARTPRSWRQLQLQAPTCSLWPLTTSRWPNVPIAFLGRYLVL